jgi:gluconokinase
MSFLCFDISSGGISAGLLDSELQPVRLVEGRWIPAPTLSPETIIHQFKQLIGELSIPGVSDPVTAISIGCFMHSFVLLDSDNLPLTPVFTWLDRGGADGVRYVQAQMGERFHTRTGCRYHPMFPVFKLAALHLSNNKLLSTATRAVSIKSFLLHALTGSWVEDHGMASASGLYNIVDGRWDPELLSLIGVTEKQLPAIRKRTDVIGRITTEAAREFGLPESAPVINGSGDGFLANIGSECETPARLSITLGTSAVARQTLSKPVLNSSSGTFCYRADEDVYLLGCAGNNGGNVLDWGRSIFGTLKDADLSVEPPIFIPLLHGERSPDWNLYLTGSWHGLTARHTAADLSRSILEGVVFNLAHFVDIVRSTSGIKPSDIVLSGNGFLHPLAAPVLAAVVNATVWMPAQPGLASLRGSGVCVVRAFNGPIPSLRLTAVAPLESPGLLQRYRQYRSLRSDRLPPAGGSLKRQKLNEQR